MEPFAELARIADAIKHAIDRDRVGVVLDGLRRELDLAFGCVLDGEPDADRRNDLVDGYRTLSRSLDELERFRTA